MLDEGRRDKLWYNQGLEVRKLFISKQKKVFIPLQNVGAQPCTTLISLLQVR